MVTEAVALGTEVAAGTAAGGVVVVGTAVGAGMEAGGMAAVGVTPDTGVLVIILIIGATAILIGVAVTGVVGVVVIGAVGEVAGAVVSGAAGVAVTAAAGAAVTALRNGMLPKNLCCPEAFEGLGRGCSTSTACLPRQSSLNLFVTVRLSSEQ